MNGNASLTEIFAQLVKAPSKHECEHFRRSGWQALGRECCPASPGAARAVVGLAPARHHPRANGGQLAARDQVLLGGAQRLVEIPAVDVGPA